MNSAVTKREANYVTEEIYLKYYANDKNERYELIDGEVWAMGKTSKAHNSIAGNIFVALKLHLKGKPCQPFMETIQVKANQNLYFPDVVVDCDVQQDRYLAGKPVLIVEVLSPSTRKLDRTQKLNDYQKIPSLQEYILIEQGFMEVTVFRRNNDFRPDYYFEGDEIYLASLDLTVAVEDIYAEVEILKLDD